MKANNGKGNTPLRDHWQTPKWLVDIPDRRISYEGLDGDGARFPSALIGVGVEPPQGLQGTLLRVVK